MWRAQWDTRFNSSVLTNNKSHVTHTHPPTQTHCEGDINQRLRGCHCLPYCNDNIIAPFPPLFFSFSVFLSIPVNPSLPSTAVTLSASISHLNSPQFTSALTAITKSQHCVLSPTLTFSLPINPFQAFTEQQMVTSSLLQIEG